VRITKKATTRSAISRSWSRSEYWKARSRAAEEMLHKIEELDAVLEEIDGDRNDHDSADWWKDASFASE
jgi:hypothetical protein